MKKFFENMKKYQKYAVRSAKAELKSEVADSRLNWLWWVIEPLCFMLVYTLVFGVVFQSKEEHFSVFIMFGLTLWDFFNRMVSGRCSFYIISCILNTCCVCCICFLIWIWIDIDAFWSYF